MPPSSNSSLFFSDGCFAGPDALVITGHFNAYPDADATRILFRFGGQWTRSDCRTDMLRSVTFSRSHGRCFLMGRNGVVRTYGRPGAPFDLESVKGSQTEVTIPDVEKYGELFRIRSVGDDVYCCGQSAQVYIFRNGTWTHADAGVLSPHGETLEDIHGTGSDNVFAVGMMGTILHFDGRAWRSLDSPTNQHLSSVRCISKDEVYACGNNGVLLRGNAERWEVIASHESKTNFWDLEIVGGDVYLTHVRGLVLFDGSDFSDIILAPKKRVTCNRLSSWGDRLLSVGADDIFLFDGKSWNEVIWPDNRIAS